MGWLRKNSDPISDRARALNDEISRLENQIKKLDAQLQRNGTHPRLRSTALPHGATVTRSLTPEPVPAPALKNPSAAEPIFEEVDQDRLNVRPEAATTPEHYNDLGVRKYDLPALLRRIRNQFRGPSTNNPKLVSYLAAGGLQGLRPLRYEKRVARNRFIALVLVLFLALLGIILVFVRHH
jgi:hypothetical protein